MSFLIYIEPFGHSKVSKLRFEITAKKKLPQFWGQGVVFRGGGPKIRPPDPRFKHIVWTVVGHIYNDNKMNWLNNVK